MPEPATSQDVQGVQDAKIAPAPALSGADALNAKASDQKALGKPTTTRTSEPSDSKGVMDFLDIPPEVQNQIAPKAEAEAKTEEEPPEEETKPEQEQEQEEEQEEEAADTAAATGKIDKRQKRINRLTRQRNEALDQVDALRSKVEEYEGKQKAGDTPAVVIPSASPWLGHITSEHQLKAEVAKAESVIDWCDANAEGANLAETAIDPEFKAAYDKGELTGPEAIQKTVAKWRRESDKIVRGAPMRLEEIRSYAAGRQHFDTISRQAWPELFDKKSEEYQLAQNLLEQFSFLKGMPQGHYALGLLIEGAKSLQSRIDKAQGNNGKQRRDISERAFEPRVPLAPHTAEPLTRPVVPSSQKELNEAMSSLVKDPDGSVTSLAAAFAAMDKTRRTRANSRTPVRA